MVLWEITLGTAYFLGLKRTYRLVLKLQRRLVGPNRLTIRQFLHRKTRTIFDATLKVHREVQQRDIEVGQNLGNWILRWLDKMKPAAQIRVGNPTQCASNTSRTTNRQLSDSSRQTTPGSYGDRVSSGRVFASSRNIWRTAYPTIAMMMMRHRKPVGNNMQYRQFITHQNTFELKNTNFGFNGVIRNDIMQWLIQG